MMYRAVTYWAVPYNARMPRLPPLHDLIAFEAAARLASFLKASEELHLTQSAVSHRIKSLEEFLGLPLFIRINRNIALTSAGERYLADVRDTLARLEAATERVTGGERKTLRISVAPALGAKWLVGKLASFQRAHPEIDLAVSSSYDIEVIRRGEADLGIRYGSEDWGGLKALKLADETVFPIASPAYVESIGGLKEPADLRRATLLRHPLLFWKPWFEAAGLNWPEPVSGPSYEDAMMMYEAAAAGHGVALTPKTLFDAQGTSLIQPFTLELPDRAYYIVLAPEAAEKPLTRLFTDWLLQAA
ncbi:MAG: transcriptional regulator [Betaproteobacteria bacterium]|nr:transcriptional regulator [Betaproteobacteria bacterium]